MTGLFVISVTPISSEAQGTQDVKPNAHAYQLKAMLVEESLQSSSDQVSKLQEMVKSEADLDLSLAIESIKVGNEKDAFVNIIANENFEYVELMNLVDRVQATGFKSIRIQAMEGLQWESFSKKRFNETRFVKPTVLAVMADLCPGCRSARDRSWSSKKILNELAARNVAIFFGVGTQDKDLKDFVAKEFGQSLPVTILMGTKMADQPKVLQKIPSEKAVLDAVAAKLPLTKPMK